MDTDCDMQDKRFKKLEHSWKFLFEMRRPKGLNSRITAWPFTLNSYASSIVVEHQTREQLMRFEWSRYISFNSLPRDCRATPMRLAQAGFYYTGPAHQATCFSCHVTNGTWPENETVMEVHRRLSPDCRFIRGESTDNVPIHGEAYYDDINRQMTQIATPHNTTTSEIQRQAGPPRQSQTNTAAGQTSISTRATSPATDTPASPRAEAAARRQAQAAGEALTAEKHPAYRELEVRISSFNHWPNSDIQDPRELAMSGFYYTGKRKDRRKPDFVVL